MNVMREYEGRGREEKARKGKSRRRKGGKSPLKNEIEVDECRSMEVI